MPSGRAEALAMTLSELGTPVICTIAWSAQAAQDFFKYTLCDNVDDGAYVTRDDYCILDPAVAALTSGDGSCAHWIGMRYPNARGQDSSLGVEMRQGYSCSYSRVPGYNCQNNLGHGLCMLNALIFALGYEKDMRSACAAIEAGQDLNTVTLGFHYNVLHTLHFVLRLVDQNKTRFTNLGTLNLKDDVLAKLPSKEIPKAQKICKSMMLSRDGLWTTMVEMIKFMVDGTTEMQRNFWSENFCRFPDGSVRAIRYIRKEVAADCARYFLSLRMRDSSDSE